MSSEVEISNLALALLGDSATVASLNPPDGSAQAEHCARWYPVARDAILELHDWGFATRRMALAEVTAQYTEWQYAYAMPSDCLKVIAIMANDATDDYSVTFPAIDSFGIANNTQKGYYTPQTFATETDDLGNKIILTNQISAVARYTRFVTDTTKFSPLFRNALAHYLASYLAGPVLKGAEGRVESKNQMSLAMGVMAKAALAGAQQQRQDVAQQVSWIAGR